MYRLIHPCGCFLRSLQSYRRNVSLQNNKREQFPFKFAEIKCVVILKQFLHLFDQISISCMYILRFLILLYIRKYYLINMYCSFLSNSILRLIINFCKNYSLNNTDFENNTNLYEILFRNIFFINDNKLLNQLCILIFKFQIIFGGIPLGNYDFFIDCIF